MLLPAPLFVELGHGRAEGFQLVPIIDDGEPGIYPVFFPILAIGLGLKGHVQFRITKKFFAMGEHPHGLLMNAPILKGTGDLRISITGRTKFADRQFIGHQMNPAQVVLPEMQLVPEDFRFFRGKISVLQRYFQRSDSLADLSGQGLFRQPPIDDKFRPQNMGQGEILQGGHGNMPQQVRGAEHFQGVGSS